MCDDRDGQSLVEKTLESEARTLLRGDTKKISPQARAKAIIEGMKLVLHHHNCPTDVVRSFCSQVTPYLAIASEADFFQRAKYITVGPMGRYLKAEPPKVPAQDFKPTGQWRRWMKSRMCVNSQNTHLWYSFLQTKRAALPLSEGMVYETYLKHRDAMGIEDPIDDESHDNVFSQLVPILQEIRAGLCEEYRVTDDLSDETGYVASTSACFENPRSKGGAVTYLRREAGVETFQPGHFVRSDSLGRSVKVLGRRPDLVRMQFYPVCSIGGVIKYNFVHEEYGYPDGQILWSRHVKQFVGVDRRLNCTIQAVLEPLKVRVISKGEAGPYYVSKRLQKALHGIMRKMPCFRLIGKPLESEDLVGLARNGPTGGSGRFEWFSIDYSAATDGLSARLSRSILSYLVERFPKPLQETFLSVLAPHECHYPRVDGHPEIDSINQKNGQLMGSILSFPILCLANLGLYLEVTKEDTRDVFQRSRGVLVNGDDMLYVARSSYWAKHVELGKKVGLVMSPGKAYHHPTVANANSMCFEYPLCTVGARPKYIPYLNSGLFFGQGKVMGGDECSEKRSITGVINELMAGCRSSKRVEVLKMYLSLHKSTVQAETFSRGFTRNLFVHESLGGMGVKPVPGFDFSVTLDQKRVAHRIWSDNPNLWFKSEVDETDPDLIELDNSVRAPWLAPARTAVWRFPGMGTGLLSDEHCISGVVLTRRSRDGCVASIQEKRSPGLSIYDPDTLAQDWYTHVSYNAYADQLTRARWVGESLQARAYAAIEADFLSKQIQVGEIGCPIDRAYVVQGNWNRRFGTLFGGALCRPEHTYGAVQGTERRHAQMEAWTVITDVIGGKAGPH
jgi:hypothetical protein